jgi:cupin 2 domain-containing protein
MLRGNFAENLPDAAGGEIIGVLARFSGRRVAVERITSGGHPTPPGEWYDQAWDEWVLLVKGSARIAFESPDAPLPEITLAEQDWVLIPARCRHRVSFTSHDAVWLAVHGDSLGDAPENSDG